LLLQHSAFHPCKPSSFNCSPLKTHLPTTPQTQKGIVEAWAAGASWSDIMADVELDDGDMARLLARTVDVLRQALFLEHLLPYLMGPAREALRGMDRPPISDLTL
jgi:superfamily II RNA helicase